jgi:Zn-dependent protease
MNFFDMGIPIGRYFGIRVRLHITFLIFAFARARAAEDPPIQLVYLTGLFICILLHEFGHALAARWCDGDADEIVLWPLGGLAFVRPAFNPTAHLITTVAGPFVTLVLAVLFTASAFVLTGTGAAIGRLPLGDFCTTMAIYNWFLLVFNMIPAFPMDGGRIVRDVLWHWIGPVRSTRFAVILSRCIAIIGLGIAFFMRDLWIGFLALFVLMGASHEYAILAVESSAPTHDFSLKERLKRGFRRRSFRSRARAAEAAGFHRCAACGRTDLEFPSLDFRVCPVCTGGKEYCSDHLRDHAHS